MMRLDPLEEFRQICMCVRAGNVAKAEQIYQDADINQPMNRWDSRTSLTFAVLNSNVAMVNFLLTQCNADPGLCDDKQRNALHYAVFEGNDEIVAMLIPHRAINFCSVDHWDQTALHLAALGNDVSIAKMVLSHCPESLNAKQSSDGRILYEIAYMNNDQGMAAFLAEASRKVELPSKFKEIVNHLEQRRADDAFPPSLEETSSSNNVILQGTFNEFQKACDQAKTEFETRINSIDPLCAQETVERARDACYPVGDGCNLADEDVDNRLRQMFEF